MGATSVRYNKGVVITSCKLPLTNTERSSRRFESGKVCQSNHARALKPPNPWLALYQPFACRNMKMPGLMRCNMARDIIAWLTVC
jgi:hypothetical protein